MAYVPYNDEKLEYDFNYHQYVLTYNGVLQGLGEDLYQYNMDEFTANKFLKRISAQVYRYIYTRVNIKSSKWVEYQLAMNPDFRDVIYEAILGQVEYFLASGGALISLQHGVSIEKSHVMDLNALRGNRKIAESTEMILLNSGILFNGHYPPFPDGVYRVDY